MVPTSSRRSKHRERGSKAENRLSCDHSEAGRTKDSQLPPSYINAQHIHTPSDSIEQGGAVGVRERGNTARAITEVDVRGDIGRVGGGNEALERGALDRDGLDERVVLPSRLVVRSVPVDHAASPLNGARRSAREACGPDGELHAGGGRWVLGDAVDDKVLAADGADDLAVDGPGEGVGLPVDGVIVVVAVGVRETAVDVTVRLGGCGGVSR